MIKVYFTQTDRLPDANTFEKRLQELPLILQQKILSYKNQQKKKQSLTGILLLKKVSNFFLLKANLEQIKYNKSGKPFFNSPLQFNISYAENLVVCAGTLQGKIGIDVEKIQPPDLSLYQSYFTLKEWEKINIYKDPYQQFFEYWTRKEAVLKAAGAGIVNNMRVLDTTEDTVVFEGAVYYLQKVNLLKNYICNIACTVAQKTDVSEADFIGL